MALSANIFQRFPERAIENRYRIEQRARQAKFIRAMIFLAIGLFLYYFTLNWLFVRPEVIFGVAAGHFSMAPLLVAYAIYVVTPGYATNRWVDFALFVAVQPSTYQSVNAFAASGDSGWAFYAEFAYNLWVELAFASLAIAASFRTFATLAGLAVVYYPLVLWGKGYDGEIIFYSTSFFTSFACIFCYINWAIDDKARALFAARISLDKARQASERLVDNMLPAPVSQRLHAGDGIADDYREVSVIFADIVGFTALSNRLPAKRIVDVLNAFFSHADRGVDLFEIDKVKTIGDAYMAVSGAITRPPRPAKAAIDFACYLIEGAPEIGRRFDIDLRLRIGVNTGPVIGGVISAKRISYDYWGGTINLAARLQSVAPVGGISVSASTFVQVRDAYDFEPPRRVDLKGLGKVEVYDLLIGAPDFARLAQAAH